MVFMYFFFFEYNIEKSNLETDSCSDIVKGIKQNTKRIDVNILFHMFNTV